jgi:hypothetical protein
MKPNIDVVSNLPGFVNVKDCFYSGFYNLICSSHIQPEINCDLFDVKTKLGRHAYLKVADHILSKGFTWPNDYFPELTINEVKAQGSNCTLSVVRQSLLLEEDCNGYSRALYRISKEQDFNAEKVARRLINK